MRSIIVRHSRYRLMLLGLVGLACAGTHTTVPSKRGAVKLDAMPSKPGAVKLDAMSSKPGAVKLDAMSSKRGAVKLDAMSSKRGAVKLDAMPSKAPVKEPAASSDVPLRARMPPPPPALPPSEPPAIDPAVHEAEAATPVPDAPSKIAVHGPAALVWVDDDKAEHGIKSVLIQPDAGNARVVAERKEPVFVGKDELWVIREKNLASNGCDECDLCETQPPTCKQNRTIDIAEPFLVSLGSGKTFEPWKEEFVPRTGCSERISDHGSELSIEGGVGSYYFFTVHTWEQSCGGAHPAYADEDITVDLDTGKVVHLTFPQQPLEALRKRAHAELVQTSCVMDPNEQPEAYRMTARYAPDGVLQGVFGFTMSAPYMCGTGPGHYTVLSEQVSAWVPRKLERWRKLPHWVAGYLGSVGAKFAFMLDATRVAAAMRELQSKR